MNKNGATEKVNVLLVDDQPDKLLAYEVILGELDENLVKTASAREALQFLLKNDVAVVLIDVCMPELDGFQLAAMIREHPRFRKTAIIFISAIHLTDVDRLRGYEMGAVDYVPVPVVPEVLRAKVRVFAELFRKTRELERLNATLERHVAERTAELQASNARLLESEQQLRLATEAAEIGLWDVDNVTDTLFWPPRVKAMFGISPDVAVSLADFYAGLHPDDKEATSAAYAGACDPQKRALYDVEYRAVGKEDGVVRWVAAKGRAVFDDDGKCVRVIGTAIDISKRKEAEERQVLLAREVDHRARNALAVIQSIIRLTRAKTVDDYVQAIEGRIKALARAHTLLSDSRWHGADLATLVTEELAPYRAGDKITIRGPDISLQPATAQGLALAVHELATNAAKHGALSSPNGKITLDWQLRGDSLTLNWAENGGPVIAEPSSRSFGLKVIVASIEQQLSGKTAFDWDPEGLRCEFSIPRSELTKSRALHALHGNGQANGAVVGLKRNEKPRVLLVEDEALVAMMIQETLAEFGFQVIGPVASASEALAAAREAQFDAAVLDINLGDGMVYTVAEILSKRGVPFVFVTGYDADSVDSRFAGVPILQKPIERNMLQKVFLLGAAHAAAADEPRSAALTLPDGFSSSSLCVQYRAHLGGELIERERLGDEIDAGVEHAAVHHGIGGVAGGEQDLQAGPPPHRLVGKFLAVDVRHHHVGEEKFHVGHAVERGQRIGGAVAVEHRIAKLVQRFGREPPHQGIILDHQNDFVAIAGAHRLERGALDLPGVGDQAGQIDFHRGAGARLAIDLDVPTRLFDEAVDLAQPEPGAFPRGLGGEKRIEDARHDVG